MKFYIQTSDNPWQEAPQLLRLHTGGTDYHFNLRHATLAQRYPGRNWCRFREHAHDVYHIVLYTRGSDALLLGEERHPVGQGSLALISPGEWHDVAVYRKEGIVYSEVTFDFIADDGAPLRLPFHELVSLIAGVSLDPVPNPLQLRESQWRELEGRFERILDWLSDPLPISFMEVCHAVNGMLVFLARECFAPHHAAQASTPDPLEETRRYIERHYRDRLTVDDLAARAGYSRGHFLRSFRKAFGISPIACQQRLRIQAACTLLRYTEYACRTIAERVGYDDEYLFSKTFRKVMGEAPTVYRRRFHDDAAMQTVREV